MDRGRDLKFRPDIEGLRALAIVPVVLYHASPALLPGGFVGVDVFFVISGYLITQLLLQRLDAGQYSLSSFYGARIRRIFPALFCMLALVVPVAVWLLTPSGLQAFGSTLGATAVFVSNIELYRTTGYFQPATDLKPLVHTWSLAVEEQYYILFPIVLALLHRHRRSATTWVLAGAGVVSLALSIWWVRADASLAFYSALSRTFELMTGSLLAVFAHRQAAAAWKPALHRRWRELLALAGLLLTALAFTGFSARTPFPGAAALLPCAGTALLIYAGGQGSTWVGRWLSAPAVRFVGAQSFSLYLWHWPILVFARHLTLGEPAPWQLALAVGLSVLMAQLSLRFVEMPVRRANHADRRLLWFGAACIALTGLVAALLVHRGADLQRLTPQQLRLHAGEKDSSSHRRRCHDGPEDVVAYADRCRFGDPASPRYTVVWADSHGAELAPVLGAQLAAQGGAVLQITSSSCPPAPGLRLPNLSLCAAHNESTLKALVGDARVECVVMLARYEHYLGTDTAGLEAGLLRAVQTLTQAGRPVVLVGPVPTYPYPVPAALAALAGRGLEPSSFGQSVEHYRQSQRQALQLVGRLTAAPGAELLSVEELLCGTGRCDVLAGERPLYFDDNHLSLTGVQRLAEALARRAPVTAGQGR